MGKIDHYFSPATTLTGSLSYDNTYVNLPDNFGLKNSDAPSHKYNAVLSLQHLFSATLVNNVRAGVNRTYQAAALDRSSNPVLNDVSLGSIPGRTMSSFFLPGNVGVFSGVGAGDVSGGHSIFGYTSYQAYDDLSWTIGRHSIRTGFSFERIDYNMNLEMGPNGKWTFNSIQKFLQVTPDLFQADLPGNNVVRGERQSVFGGYIQDDFRVRSNLTFNLGVRYEMGTVVDEVHNRIANLRNLTDSQTTIGRPYYNNPTLRNFAPRFGFAWSPDTKTVLRGGYGVYYNPTVFNIALDRKSVV